MILRNVPLSSFLFDKNLEVVEANDACRWFHGVSSVEDLQENILTANNWAFLVSKVADTLRGNQGTFKYCFHDPRGNQTRWAEAAASKVFDTQGNFIGVSVIEKDATFKESLIRGLQSKYINLGIENV